jgi:hypothetical protein
MRYSQEQIVNALQRLNMQIFDKQINIVFVRENFNFDNIFNDRLYIWNNCIPFTEFVVTTKAGKTWWEGFTNPKGVAGLVENQYINAYAIGMHRNSYEALVQVAPVVVYRDANKDKQLDTGLTERGLFGINYHTMSVSRVIVAKQIDNGSAGCMVNPDTKAYFESMALIKATRQSRYTLTLLNKKLITE